MKHTTYSFTALAGSIHHPTVGDYLFTGEGVGACTVAKITDRTAHDVASDGSIMISKVAGNNGTLTIEAQQTSPVQTWLQNWFNELVALPANEWATTSVLLKDTLNGNSHLCTGVSPQKEGDVPYQAQGGRVTWVLMCADIQNNPI